MKKITKIITILAIIIAGVFIFNNLGLAIYQPIVKGVAEQNNVSPSLILAIIKAESNFKEDAVSSKGAIGLMQIMPETAEWISTKTGIKNDPTNPLTNISMGTWYFGSFLLPKYNGDEKKALAAYNAGYGNVDKWEEGVIAFPETDNYVKKVLWWKGIFGLVP